MDKTDKLKKIAKIILDVGENKNIIETREVDKIIYQVTGKMERNTKYEFREYLYTFDLINNFISNEIKSNNAFIIEKENIKRFLNE